MMQSIHLDRVLSTLWLVLLRSAFCAKAIDDSRVKYSADASDIQSRLLVQHYRIYLQVESEDPMWDGDSVEWVEEQFLTVKVLDNDRQALIFSSLSQDPIVLRRGDSVGSCRLRK